MVAEDAVPRRAGILAIWNDCVAGAEDTYEHWYRSEHLAERVGIAGFLSGWRYIALDAQPAYFTHYVTDSVDVLCSDAYHERLNNPTPLTQAIMSGVFINCTRTICERVLRLGDARGACALVARFVSVSDIAELGAAVQQLAQLNQVLRAELWAASTSSAPSSFAEFELRGPDDAIGACVMIETADEADARAIAPSVGATLAAAEQIGVYRLMCSLQQSDQRR